MLKSAKEERDSVFNRMNELEREIDDLDRVRINLFDKVKRETEQYSRLLNETFSRLENRYNEELQAVRNKYMREMKSYHIDFEKIEKEEIGKRELLKNLSDLVKIRKKYKEVEVELFKTLMKQETENLMPQYNKIGELKQEYTDSANKCKTMMLEKFNLLNKYKSFQKAEDLHYQRKTDLYEIKIGEYYDNNISKIKEVVPYLQGVVDTQIESIVKKLTEKFSNDTLYLDQHKDYITKLYRIKNSEALFMAKYHLLRLKETDDKIKSKIYKEIINENLKKLHKYSIIFEDDFSKELLETSQILKKDRPSRNEILKDFEMLSSDILFNTFFHESEDSIFNFLFSYLFEVIGKPTLRTLYNPLYMISEGKENDTVKTIKTLNYIQFYLQRQEYKDAYKLMENLRVNPEANRLKDKLEMLVKNELVLDVLEKHFI